jgi:death on curing protein
MLDVMHSELIREHGGAPGIREDGENLIESALARPRNRFAYAPDSDLCDLAAGYLFGLAKNHGYADGNKRIAFAAATVFLMINGLVLNASETEAYEAVIGLVELRCTEQEAAQWIRAHTEPSLPSEAD